MKTITTFDIALLFTTVDTLAGQSYGKDEQDAETRARNLVENRYILAGDPHGWNGGGDQAPVATLYAERKGGDTDCHPPADYYDRWPELEGDLWWEWTNPAVAGIYHLREPVEAIDSPMPAEGLSEIREEARAELGKMRARLNKAEAAGQVELHVDLDTVRLMLSMAEVALVLDIRSKPTE